MSQDWDAPKFTCDYSQPEDYKFSLDTILLAKAAAYDLKRDAVAGPLKVLDLCAGAGVVGLEFSFYYDAIASFDFLEIQEAYRPHFETNLVRTPLGANKVPVRWLEQNYDRILLDFAPATYDLILCNPPYFEADHGKIPPNRLKARSRFFLDSDFETLWEVILRSLNPNGRAYVLMRGLDDHGASRTAQLQKKIGPQGEPTLLRSLRGTDLVRLVRR